MFLILSIIYVLVSAIICLFFMQLLILNKPFLSPIFVPHIFHCLTALSEHISCDVYIRLWFNIFIEGLLINKEPSVVIIISTYIFIYIIIIIIPVRGRLSDWGRSFDLSGLWIYCCRSIHLYYLYTVLILGLKIKSTFSTNKSSLFDQINHFQLNMFLYFENIKISMRLFLHVDLF